MLEGYEDILSRISEPPIWYDQNGVPRYAKFHPNMCPNIYADKVVLAQIACQECGEKFLVEMHASIWSDRDASDPRKWHYGDPPLVIAQQPVCFCQRFLNLSSVIINI